MVGFYWHKGGVMRWLSRTIIIVVVTLLALEVVLRLFVGVLSDPFGAYTYYRTQAQIRHTPGVYQFETWALTYNDDMTRAVPQTETRRDCTIAFVGDSVTFGQSVNDHEAFPAIAAGELPDVTVINAGFMGFDIHDVERRMGEIEADGYIYLIIANDALDRGWRLRVPASGLLSHTVAHWHYFRSVTFYSAPNNVPAFEQAYGRIAARDNVLTFAFTEADAVLPLDEQTVRIGSRNTLPVISLADGHPNVDGQRDIWNRMQPAALAFVQSICN